MTQTLDTQLIVSDELLEFSQLSVYSFFFSNPHPTKPSALYMKVSAIHAVRLKTQKREELESWIPVQQVTLTGL